MAFPFPLHPSLAFAAAVRWPRFLSIAPVLWWPRKLDQVIERHKNVYELARIRTWNLLIRSQTRYPLRHKPRAGNGKIFSILTFVCEWPTFRLEGNMNCMYALQAKIRRCEAKATYIAMQGASIVCNWRLFSSKECVWECKARETVCSMPILLALREQSFV